MPAVGRMDAEETLPSKVVVDDASEPSDAVYSIDGMSWGIVELEPEVRDWLEQLPTERFATATFYIDLLADEGPLLGEPYTRQLHDKLRELRSHLDRQAVRITYWIATGWRIILLTVFTKSRVREVAEIARTRRAYARCVAEAHRGGGRSGWVSAAAGPTSATSGCASRVQPRHTKRPGSPLSSAAWFGPCASSAAGARRNSRELQA